MNPFEGIGAQLAERPGHAYTESVKWKGSRRPRHYDNLWQLTPAEVLVIEALVVEGSTNGAASVLSLSPRTVMLHTTSIRKKMEAPTTMLAVLAWDREMGERG